MLRPRVLRVSMRACVRFCPSADISPHATCPQPGKSCLHVRGAAVGVAVVRCVSTTDTDSKKNVLLVVLAPRVPRKWARIASPSPLRMGERWVWVGGEGEVGFAAVELRLASKFKASSASSLRRRVDDPQPEASNDRHLVWWFRVGQSRVCLFARVEATITNTRAGQQAGKSRCWSRVCMVVGREPLRTLDGREVCCWLREFVSFVPSRLEVRPACACGWMAGGLN